MPLQPIPVRAMAGRSAIERVKQFLVAVVNNDDLSLHIRQRTIRG